MPPTHTNHHFRIFTHTPRARADTQPDTYKAAGFTLAEIIITILIIGVLTTIAIPIYISQQAKARATCAQTQVSALARQQQGFFAENNEFAADFTTLGVAAPIACPGYAPANVSRAVIDASPETADGYCVKATLSSGKYTMTKFKGICGSG